MIPFTTFCQHKQDAHIYIHVVSLRVYSYPQMYTWKGNCVFLTCNTYCWKHTTALLNPNIVKATKDRLQCYSTMSKILVFNNKIKPWHARKSTLISQSSLHQLHSITVPNHTARNNPGQNLSTVNQGACALY